MPPREFFIVRDYRVAPRVAAAAPSRATRPVVAEDHSDEDSLDGLIEASETLWSTLEAPSAPLWSREFEDSDTPRRTHWEDAEPARREEEAEPPRKQPRMTCGQEIPKPRDRAPRHTPRPARRPPGEEEDEYLDSDDAADAPPPRKRRRTTTPRPRTSYTSKYYGTSRTLAAHAYNTALRRDGLESRRIMNKVDEMGRLVAKPTKPTTPLDSDQKSRYYGVYWDRYCRRFKAQYTTTSKAKQKTVGCAKAGN